MRLLDGRRRGLIVVGAIAALVAASAGLTPVAATDHDVLQPGDSLGGYCTLNFVFDGAGDRYIGTAGHCVDAGDRASNPDIGEFGTVIYDSSVPDFALIDVDDSVEPQLAASLDGHPDSPTGVATPEDTSPGDVLRMSGYGVGVSATEPTREERRSVLVDHTDETYDSSGPIVNGDSGAPFVVSDSGEALGIVSRYNFFDVPPTTDVGPTVDYILSSLHANGYDVALSTVS